MPRRRHGGVAGTCCPCVGIFVMVAGSVSYGLGKAGLVVLGICLTIGLISIAWASFFMYAVLRWPAVPPPPSSHPRADSGSRKVCLKTLRYAQSAGPGSALPGRRSRSHSPSNSSPVASPPTSSSSGADTSSSGARTGSTRRPGVGIAEWPASSSSSTTSASASPPASAASSASTATGSISISSSSACGDPREVVETSHVSPLVAAHAATWQRLRTWHREREQERVAGNAQPQPQPHPARSNNNISNSTSSSSSSRGVDPLAPDPVPDPAPGASV